MDKKIHIIIMLLHLCMRIHTQIDKIRIIADKYLRGKKKRNAIQYDV